MKTQCASPSGSPLRDVRDLDAEAGTVADRVADLVVALGHHHAELFDPCAGKLLDDVEDDGLVRDRHELLGARMRDRAQASAGTAGENQTFHPGALCIRPRGASAQRQVAYGECAVDERDHIRRGGL